MNHPIRAISSVSLRVLSALTRPFTRRHRDAPFLGLAVGVLGLGLGAAGGVLTYLRAFDQPLPGVPADGLMRVFRAEPETPRLDLSYPDYRDLAAELPSLTAAVRPAYAASFRIGGRGGVVFIEVLDGRAFEVLGIETFLGRGFVPDDDRPGADPVAVISDEWWRRQWGGDPGVLGETLILNGRPFTIVGVTSPDYLGIDAGIRPQVWMPIAPFADRYTSWGDRSLERDVPLVRVYARTGPDGADRLEARLADLDRALDEAHPLAEGTTRKTFLEKATWIDPEDREEESRLARALRLSVGGFLVLVCANAANLLLARSERRRGDLALRAALGASPGRLVRSHLVAAAGVGLAAGLLGAAVSVPLARRLGSYFERPSVWGENVSRVIPSDPGVVTIVLLLAVGTGLLAGLPAGLRILKTDLVAPLGSRSSELSAPSHFAGFRVPDWRTLLITTQVAMSVLLLCVSALVVRTLQVVQGLDTGFEHSSMVMSHVSTSSADVAVEDRDVFFRRLSDTLSAESWVESAAFSRYPPLQGQPTRAFRIDGSPDPVEVHVADVQARFFRTLGLRLLEGREFDERDGPDARPVVVVDEGMANGFLGGRSAVGRTLRWSADDGTERSAEVVGIVSSCRLTGLTGPIDPVVYFPYRQGMYGSGAALLVRTVGSPDAFVGELERWLRSFESRLAIVNVVSYPQIVRGLSFEPRRNVELFSGLAGLGLVLSALVVFGVVALAGASRRREIGIRRALGARRRQVSRFLVSRTMVPVGIGLGIGLAVAGVGADLVRGLLYGVEPLDVVSLASAGLTMLAVSLLAAYLPARTAARQDPVRALAAE